MERAHNVLVKTWKVAVFAYERLYGYGDSLVRRKIELTPPSLRAIRVLRFQSLFFHEIVAVNLEGMRHFFAPNALFEVLDELFNGRRLFLMVSQNLFTKIFPMHFLCPLLLLRPTAVSDTTERGGNNCDERDDNVSKDWLLAVLGAVVNECARHTRDRVEFAGRFAPVTFFAIVDGGHIRKCVARRGVVVCDGYFGLKEVLLALFVSKFVHPNVLSSRNDDHRIRLARRDVEGGHNAAQDLMTGIGICSVAFVHFFAVLDVLALST